MEELQELSEIGIGLDIYYIIEFFLFLWISYQYRRSQISILIILLYFFGLFGFFGKTGFEIQKIITLLGSVYVVINNGAFSQLNSKLRIALGLFSVFAGYYFITSFVLNGDPILITMSQLSKYIIPILLFFEMYRIALKNPQNLYILNNLFYKLLLIQIGLNFIKLLILGATFEGMVGSITGVGRGGGVGTTIPLIGLCWIALNTNFIKLDKRTILFLAGLLFIGFMTGKRAVWLLFPVLFFVYSMYVSKKKYPRRFLYALLLTPLLFYVGLRLSPTLNPERKVWGSFDIEYAWNYIMDYSAGKEDASGDRGEGTGRIGANKLLWNATMDTDTHTNETWFGYGNTRIYAADYSRYTDQEYNFGAKSRGSLTSIFMMFIAIGVIGVILFLAYFISIFFQVKYTRLRWTLLGVALFDFIFYNGTIIREPALCTLLLFLILYSRIQYDKEGNFVGKIYNISLKRLSKVL